MQKKLISHLVLYISAIVILYSFYTYSNEIASIIVGNDITNLSESYEDSVLLMDIIPMIKYQLYLFLLFMQLSLFIFSIYNKNMIQSSILVKYYIYSAILYSSITSITLLIGLVLYHNVAHRVV